MRLSGHERSPVERGRGRDTAPIPDGGAIDGLTHPPFYLFVDRVASIHSGFIREVGLTSGKRLLTGIPYVGKYVPRTSTAGKAVTKLNCHN